MRWIQRFRYRHRLLFVPLFVGVCLFSIGCGQKAKEAKVYRVGIIGSVETFSPIADGFRAKMAELGYRSGENILYDIQVANMDLSEQNRVTKKFIDDQVNLIFTFPTNAAIAVKEATQETDIPVVFALAGLEGNRLVESMHKPGGRISGVRYPGPEATGKRLEILHELMPGVMRVLITYDPNYPTAPRALEELQLAAAALGIQLVKDPVNNLNELQAALHKRTGSGVIGVEAILIMPEALTQSPAGWALLNRFAAEHKLPIAGSLCFTIYNGAVFGFSPDLFDTGSSAAPIADKIFKGTPAGEIMVVTPKSRLWFNYRLARELGINPSEGLLSRADKIIR